MSVVNAVKNLSGKVALVTGASRGIGKGIAKSLVNSGADVYITGRKNDQNSTFPSIMDTAIELNKMKSGNCYGIFCDHKNDNEVDDVFNQIIQTHKRLDLMINNAFSGGDSLKDVFNKNFWEIEPEFLWSKIIDVGLRSTYICSVKASRIMIEQKSGLIANISSMGGLVPMFGPLYSVGKEGADRMAVDMGLALKPHRVTVVSLWPGVVKTEASSVIKDKPGNEKLKALWPISEDPTLAGKVICQLFQDENKLKKSAKVHLIADLAHEYSLTDTNNVVPISFRSVRFGVYQICPALSYLVPHQIKIPGWILSAFFNKF